MSLLFSAEGRIGRGRFWIGLLILFVAGVLISLAVTGLVLILGRTGQWIGFALLLLFLYPAVVLSMKRLRDRGHAPQPVAHRLFRTGPPGEFRADSQYRFHIRKYRRNPCFKPDRARRHAHDFGLSCLSRRDCRSGLFEGQGGAGVRMCTLSGADCARSSASAPSGTGPRSGWILRSCGGSHRGGGETAGGRRAERPGGSPGRRRWWPSAWW